MITRKARVPHPPFDKITGKKNAMADKCPTCDCYYDGRGECKCNVSAHDDD